MARAALILAIASGCVPAAAQVGLGTGVGYASLAGAYRDDTIASLRASMAVQRDVAVDVDLDEDADRIENSLGAGVRWRPLTPPCWAPYLRGSLSLVNASHVVSDVDVLAGAGYWGHLWTHLAWFAEVDAVARLGEPNTASLRLQIGFAIETADFWR